MQLSDLFTTLDETEKYCLSKHLIDKQLFEITDPEVIRKLSSSLEGNRFIRLWGYGQNKRRIEALRYYTSFLEEFDVKSLSEKNSMSYGLFCMISHQIISEEWKAISSKIFPNPEELSSSVVLKRM